MKIIKNIILVNSCLAAGVIANAKDAIQLEIREIRIPKSARTPDKIDTSSPVSLFREIQKLHPEASMSMLTSIELKNNEISQKKSGYMIRNIASGEEQLIGTELTACVVSESPSATEVVINLKQRMLEKFIEERNPNSHAAHHPVFSIHEFSSRITLIKGASTIIGGLQNKDGVRRIIAITLKSPESTQPRS